MIDHEALALMVDMKAAINLTQRLSRELDVTIDRLQGFSHLYERRFVRGESPTGQERRAND